MKLFLQTCWTLFLMACTFVGFVVFLVLLSIFLKAFPDPSHYDGLQRFELVSQPADAREGAGDLDHDGFLDRVVVTYHRREPLFESPTSGLVTVYSGRDESRLLVHPVPVPIVSRSWCDHDGDGNEDLCLKVRTHEYHVFSAGD